MLVLAVGIGCSDFTGRPLAQQNGTPMGVPGTNPPPPFGEIELPKGQKEKMAIAQSEARQKQLVMDTDKLLELATELHADVAKTDKNILSVDVIKRADEIEKLAHAVKEKMRG